MDPTTAGLIRHIFTNSTLRQTKIRDTIIRDLAEEEGYDAADLLEAEEAVHTLFTFIASHGLESTSGTAYQRGWQDGHSAGYKDGRGSVSDAIALLRGAIASLAEPPGP